MNSSLRSRTPSKLSDSVQHRLNMYALAASAAGVSLLALSQAAEAKIVYTKTHQVIRGFQHYDLDLNHDKITDFVLINTSSAYGQVDQTVKLSGLNGNSAVFNTKTCTKTCVSALKMGSYIGPGRHFQGGTGILIQISSLGNRRGQWYNATNRYLGLKFGIRGKTHYGWARLNVQGTPGNITATLTGYAYETVPKKAIIAGKTKGPDVITMEPATLGRLALGRR